MATCHRCDEPSVLHVNGIETCPAHWADAVDLAVEQVAEERGIDRENARRAVAKLFREALGQ